jgi:hypothetical protein
VSSSSELRKIVTELLEYIGVRYEVEVSPLDDRDHLMLRVLGHGDIEDTTPEEREKLKKAHKRQTLVEVAAFDWYESAKGTDDEQRTDQLLRDCLDKVMEKRVGVRARRNVPDVSLAEIWSMWDVEKEIPKLKDL